MYYLKADWDEARKKAEDGSASTKKGAVECAEIETNKKLEYDKPLYQSHREEATYQERSDVALS